MSLLYVIWLVPLVGALVLWAFGPQLERRAGWVGSASIGIAFIATVLSFGAGTARTADHAVGTHLPMFSWTTGFDFGLLLDPLSLIWSLIITGVGFLIHVYSIGYMAGDRAIARFFAYMNFFVFAMLTLVLSDNFVGLLVGWGLVGLASFFLIGFHIERPAAKAAATKAFVINVVGDVGLMAALFLLFANTGSIAYAVVFGDITKCCASGDQLFLICLGLFIAAAAKSAQVPLHTWLPDAMEGPTPVSALIHAATMVTAGVYLIARCWPLFIGSPGAQEMVGTAGALTALLGAILGLAQWDIKRVLAYSTMSQIGYMIMGVGVGAYDAGVLHFFAHAFFKAQLFLAAGLIIHQLGDEQDMRRMGALRTRMPLAYWAMLTGTGAIIGFPGFSGFFSKDAVIYGTLMQGHPWLFIVAVATAGITGYYMSRMIFIVFFGTDRTQLDAAHAHAPPWSMKGPVALLIVPTVLAGFVDVGFRGQASLWSQLFEPVFTGSIVAVNRVVPFSEAISSVLVFFIVLIGVVLAYARYATVGAQVDDVARLQTEAAGMPKALVHALYVDALIEEVLLRPARTIGAFFARVIDPHAIDAVVRDIVWLAALTGQEFRLLQNGLVRSYALTIVAGVAGFLMYFVWIGAGR